MAFVAQYHGITRPDAALRLETLSESKPLIRASDDSPSETWQQRARRLLASVQAHLWGPEGDRARAYLHRDRGLTYATIRSWGLGYNPQDVWDDSGDWGLTGAKAVYIPRGIVIPCEISGVCWYVKVRLPRVDRKYLLIRGSKPALFGVDNVTGRLESTAAVFATEGEFDAMLLDQELRGRVCVVTMGSATTRVSPHWLWQLRDARQILVVYDRDPAGASGAQQWANISARVRTVQPLEGDDLTAMHMAGGNLQAWGQYHLSAAERARLVKHTDAGNAISRAHAYNPGETQSTPHGVLAAAATKATYATNAAFLDRAIPGAEVRVDPVVRAAKRAPRETVARPETTGDARSHAGPSVLLSPEDAIHRLGTAKTIGFDLETTGLDPHTDCIRLVSLATDHTACVIDAWAYPDWAHHLQPLLVDPQVTKVIHNAAFDLAFLLQAGIEPCNVVDTMIAAQLIDGGQNRQRAGWFTLQGVAERELKHHVDKSEQRSDWSVPSLTDEQIAYAAGDAGILPDLWRVLSGKIAGAGLAQVMALELATLPAIVWLTLNGAPIDTDGWRKCAEDATKRAGDAECQIIELAGRPLNPRSRDQVRKVLHEVGIKVESTADKVLAEFEGHHPIVAAIRNYRQASKLAQTYGIKFLQHVNPATGRIHPHYKQIGAATGRMACSKPNLQNIPADANYRGCFRAPPGRVLVRADLKLIELRIAAELSGDRRMIDALNNGADLHRLTAAALFEKEAEAITPSERAFGKTVNFGMLFGQGPQGLMMAAKEQGQDITKADARRLQERSARAWPALNRWQRQQMRSKVAVIRLPSGRIRRIDASAPATVRANTPVQGTAADGFKAGLARLLETRGRYPTALPVLAVHDELVVECDEADAEGVALWVEECLRLGMGRFLQSVDVHVEKIVSKSWGGD